MISKKNNLNWLKQLRFQNFFMAWFANIELVKYTLTSLIATIADFSTFYLLHDVNHLSALSSVLIGQIVGSLVSFFLLYKWVFQFVERQVLLLSLKFFCGQLASAVLNVWVVGFIIFLFHIDAWASRILSSVLLWVTLFLLNKLWVFRSQKSAS